MTVSDESLLRRVAQGIARPGAATGTSKSILAQAASSYGARPMLDEMTVPTGFDPAAAALFEAVVEAAFLVATSDGHFDDDERAAFQSVVANACGDVVQASQISGMLADFGEQLAEDGLEQRARRVAATVTRRDHQGEVLRIAALMAHISGGVSDPERRVLDQLASDFQLGRDVVDEAVAQAASALAE